MRVAALAADAQVVDVPMYQIDGLVRRATSLQNTLDGKAPSVTLWPRCREQRDGPGWRCLWDSFPDYVHSAVFIVALTVVLIVSVALLTLWERKLIGWMQLRKGPNRVAIFGLLPGVGQPFADVIKLLIKEVVIPAKSNKVLFRIAPAIALIPAFATWAVMPIAPGLCDRQGRCGAAVRAVADVGRRVRRDPGWLGLQLQVRLPGCDALGGADRGL